MTKTATAQSAAEREVVTSRLINAPREVVWQVWTDPKHITQWWGPNGFRTTIRDFDFRNGGTWRFTMHGPDGTDFLNRVVFEDIEKPNYIYYKHTGEGEHSHILFEAVVTFEDRSGKTNVTLRSIFATAQERDFVVENYGAIEGAVQTLERLEATVMNRQSADTRLSLTLPSENQVCFTRMFEAPRELVWKAWTEAKHLQCWMTGPEGWTMEVVEQDLRPGGQWRYVWRRPEREDMWLHGLFKEVVSPERIVSTENWGEPWPESVNDVVFTQEDGQTRMTMTITYPSRAARDSAIQTGMDDGMGISFDRLDKLLASL